MYICKHMKALCSICMIVALIAAQPLTAFAAGRGTEDHIYDIRIVNMDTGAKNGNEELMLYSTTLAQSPDESLYSYCSLSEAKTLMEESQIDAYIIIPSDFSECIESINTVPRQCEVTYAINRSQEPQIQYRSLQYVQDYLALLQKRITQTYLLSLMREVHTAQDAAQTVMDNDRNNKETLDSVQNSDVLASTTFPNIPQTAPPFGVLDYSVFTNRAAEIISDMETDLQTQADGIQEQADTLKSDVLTLGANYRAHTGNMLDHVNRIESYDTETDMAQADALISTANTAVVGTAAECSTFLSNASLETEELINAINEAVKASNEDERERTGKELRDILDKCAEQVPLLAVTETEDSVILEWKAEEESDIPDAEDNEPSANGNETAEGTETAVDDEEPSLLFRIETSEQDEKVATNNRELLALLSVNLLAADQTEETFEYEATTTEGEPENLSFTYGQAVKQTLDALDAEPGCREMLELGGYTDIRGFIQAVEEGTVLFQAKPYITVESTEKEVEDFCSYAADAIDWEHALDEYDGFSVDAYKKDAEGLYVLDEEGNKVTLYKETAEALTSVIAAAEGTVSATMLPSALDALNSAGNAVSVARTTMNGFLENAMSVKADIQAEGMSADAELEEFIRQQQGVTMNFSTQAGDNAMVDISENNATLLRSAQDTIDAMNDYAQALYVETDSNYATLRQYITDAQAASDQAVIDGLAKVKESWANTSKSNQELMQEFADLFKNTRVGTQEYRELYTFMAAPVNAKDISATDNGFQYISPNEEESPLPEALPEVPKQEGIWISRQTLNYMTATAVVAVIALAGFFWWRYKKSLMKNRSKENVNQFN